jgi:hypothetical protein
MSQAGPFCVSSAEILFPALLNRFCKEWEKSGNSGMVHVESTSSKNHSLENIIEIKSVKGTIEILISTLKLQYFYIFTTPIHS